MRRIKFSTCYTGLKIELTIRNVVTDKQGPAKEAGFASLVYFVITTGTAYSKTIAAGIGTVDKSEVRFKNIRIEEL